MNILRQQDILKGVPDQRLMQEMQSPSGSVPQFLVMSEMQRRKGMRDEFTSRQESPSTVAEDLVGVEKAQAGLGPQPLGVGQSPTTIQAGLPQPAQPAPPVMMESGGVVKYQEGTEGLTVLSDDELIAMYRSIGPDGKLNGSSRNADEVLMEVQDRELVLGTNPYTQNISSLTERIIKGPQVEESQPVSVGEPLHNIQPKSQNVAPDSLTGGKSTLELLSEVGSESINAPSMITGSPMQGVARGDGRIPRTEVPVSQGLPYSDEGLGGRDNLYRPTVDFLDKMGVDVSPSGPKPKPEPQVLSNNIGDYYPGRTSPASLDNIKGYLSSIGDYITSRAAPVVEGSPEDLLQKYQEGEEIRKAYADMDVGMGPVVNQAGSVVNPFPGAVSPQEQARLNNIKLLSKTPTPAPNNPVVAEAPPTSPAVVSPVVSGSDQEAINRAGGVASSGEFDIRSDDAGLNVTKEQNKVAKKIQENPALAYEKMRKDGISDAQAMGLIMAGLGIMEAASQPGATALGSLSGAKAGVQQYSKDLQALNERIEKRRLADEDKRYKERRLEQEDEKININLKTATAAEMNAEANRIKANAPPEAIRIMEDIINTTDKKEKAQKFEMYSLRYGRRDPVDKSIPNQATMARTEKAYVDGPQMSRDARALVDKNSKEWKEANSQQRLKLMDAAKSLAINNYMKARFGNAYRPSSSVSRKTPQASLASFNKKD